MSAESGANPDLGPPSSPRKPHYLGFPQLWLSIVVCVCYKESFSLRGENYRIIAFMTSQQLRLPAEQLPKIRPARTF